MENRRTVDELAAEINALPPQEKQQVIEKIRKPIDLRTEEEKDKAFRDLAGSFHFDTTPEDLIKDIESSRTYSDIKNFDI